MTAELNHHLIASPKEQDTLDPELELLRAGEVQWKKEAAFREEKECEVDDDDDRMSFYGWSIFYGEPAESELFWTLDPNQQMTRIDYLRARYPERAAWGESVGGRQES